MNVGKSKVMRCSRYGNGNRMHVILNGEPLKQVACFKYLGSQVAADGGCERDVVHRIPFTDVVKGMWCTVWCTFQSLESAEKCPEQ